MPNFMLHFACAPSRTAVENEQWTADACVITSNLEEAENSARDLIALRAYQANELIAFAEVGEDRIASLSQLEATLYLKAQQSDKQAAVVFSQWHD